MREKKIEKSNAFGHPPRPHHRPNQLTIITALCSRHADRRCTDQLGGIPASLALQLGTVASCLPVLVLVLYYNLNLMSLYWYYPVHAAIGAFSSTSLTLAAVSDSMAKENRAAAFGIVISFAYIGFIVGPVLGRVVTTADDALYVSLALVVLCAVYVLVVLEETLPCKVTLPHAYPAVLTSFIRLLLLFAHLRETHVGWLRQQKKKHKALTIRRGAWAGTGGDTTAGVTSAGGRHAGGAAASDGRA